MKTPLTLHSTAGATGHWAGSWGYSYYTNLVYPNDALAAKAKQDGSAYTYTQNNYDLAAIKKAASANSDATCLAFGGAHSGEETDRYDNANAGDRQNLTLWHGADAMIEAVASSCKNTSWSWLTARLNHADARAHSRYHQCR